MIKQFSARSALVLSTLVAASGFLVMALPLGFAGLCVGLILAGLGSSVQHPRASLLVTISYGKASRGPLGIYSFSGDLGKATLPAIVAVLLPLLAWRPVVALSGLLGLAVAGCLFGMIHSQPANDALASRQRSQGQGYSGFTLLMSIGVLDTAVRMGYLLFLPFLIDARDGTSVTVGLGLALVFIGGALGKATCNWLSQRLGVAGSVILTELATAILIVATLFWPLMPMLAFLPLLGVVLTLFSTPA